MNRDKVITLYPRITQHILLLIITLIFTVGGIWIGIRGDWIGYLCASFFGLGPVISIIQMLPGSSFLKISKNGFEYSSLFRRHSVKWEDIEEFSIMTQTYSGMTTNKMVGWSYVREPQNKSLGRTLSKSITGIEAGLPDTYSLKADALLALMVEHWEEQRQVSQNIIYFIENFKKEDVEKIMFDWNGKHAEKLEDKNMLFRNEVLSYIKNNKEDVPIELIASLYEAETQYAKEAWCVNQIVSDLAQELLERGRTKYLHYYSKGISCGMDAYLQSQAINLTSDCLKELYIFCSTANEFFFDDDEKRELLSELFKTRLETIDE